MTYNYEYNCHSQGLVELLNEQRLQNSHLCDITLLSETQLGAKRQFGAHKCVMAASSSHLEEIINMPDNQQHNIEYDVTTLADADSVQSLVEFAYLGKLTFTPENFTRLTEAITKLKVKNIDQVSIDKIKEDIEVSRKKVPKVVPPPQIQTIPIRTVQIGPIVNPPQPTISRPKFLAHESPGKNKPRILPKVENFADGNVHLMLVPETLVNSRGGLDTPEDVRVNQEDSENLLRILDLTADECATVARQKLEELIEKCRLTPHQKSQVWEIRRKSKNRLAAAKCRKRKLEDIRQNDENFDQLRDQFAERLSINEDMRLNLEIKLKQLTGAREQNLSAEATIQLNKMINTVNEVLKCNPPLQFAIEDMDESNDGILIHPM